MKTTSADTAATASRSEGRNGPQEDRRPTTLRRLAVAEFRRARQSRSTVVVLSLFVVAALTALILRAAVGGGTPLGAETATLNADYVGFGTFLVAACAVAKDHGTGTIDLLRVLVPSRPRHLIARATGIGLLSLLATGIVILAGLVVLLLEEPSAATDPALLGCVVRTAAAVFLLAAAGTGVGALTRSSAVAACAVLTLYLLLPLALMIAALSGVGWAVSFSERTLQPLTAQALSPGGGGWAALSGVALWSIVLLLLGILREAAGSRPRRAASAAGRKAP